jgi:hypothetical protein
LTASSDFGRLEIIGEGAPGLFGCYFADPFLSVMYFINAINSRSPRAEIAIGGHLPVFHLSARGHCEEVRRQRLFLQKAFYVNVRAGAEALCAYLYYGFSLLGR